MVAGSGSVGGTSGGDVQIRELHALALGLIEEGERGAERGLEGGGGQRWVLGRRI